MNRCGPAGLLFTWWCKLLKDFLDEVVKSKLKGLDATDLQHMLIGADAGNGVIAVPLSKYKDDNIRICRPFGIFPQDLESQF